MTILKAAVVGPGGRAGAHLAVLPKLTDRFKLVAVSDIDEERARTVASEMSCNAYTDVVEMVDKEKPDVCLIAVQAEIHHVVARILADRKVHLLTETPIAITVPCAKAMQAAAAENGVLLEVSENVRRWPHERLKRRIVESGLIGDVESFYLSYTSGSYHGISGIRAILESEAVSATGEFPDEPNVKERGQIEWSGGIKGTYECNSERKNHWEITGTKGSIAGKQLHLGEGDRTLEIITETVGEDEGKTVSRTFVDTDPPVSWESPYQAYALPEGDNVSVADVWCSLYDGVVEGKALDYGGENGTRDVELLNAIRGSAVAGGERIGLPLTGMTAYEKEVHAAFEEAYGMDIMEMGPSHLKQRYDLAGDLRDLLYYGRVLSG